MSLAIIKPANKKMPKDEILEICCRNNRGGSGFSYLRDGNLIIKKGFISFYYLKKQLDIENIKDEEPVFFYFKNSATGLDLKNIQPLPIIDSIKLMNERSIANSGKTVFMHIGKIEYKDIEYDDYIDPYTFNIKISDTMLFSINLYYYMYKKDKNVLTDLNGNIIKINKYSIEYLFNLYFTNKDKIVKRQIDESVGENKFAFMNSDGKLVLFGKGWKINNGIFYSEKQCFFDDDKKVTVNDSSFQCKECGGIFLKEKCSHLLSNICKECEKQHRCSSCGSVYLNKDSLILGVDRKEKFCYECLK